MDRAQEGLMTESRAMSPFVSKERISIITVNYNSGTLLMKCLESIFAQECSQEIEVIIIDNKSTDKSIEGIETLFPQIKLIKNKKNTGYTKGNNVGIRQSEGKYVVLLNPDTVLMRNAVQQMSEFMDRTSDAGAIGPKLINTDGSLQLSCRSFPSWRNALFSRYSLLTRLFPRNKYSVEYLYTDWPHNEIKEVDWLSGACLMIRREVFEKIGLFDEAFFMYCEDVDICYRIKQAGWKNLYYPYAEVVHYIGCGKEKIPIRLIVNHHISMYKFYRKHYSKKRFLLDILIFGGIIINVFLTIGYRKLINKIR